MDLTGFDGDYDARRISAEISKTVPAFSGIDLDSAEGEGCVLAGEAGSGAVED
jgi:hypothetical protein